MTAEQKKNNAALVEEQTVLLRCIAESLATLVECSGATKPAVPVGTQRDSAVNTVQS